jgi:hypothetical protein
MLQATLLADDSMPGGGGGGGGRGAVAKLQGELMDMCSSMAPATYLQVGRETAQEGRIGMAQGENRNGRISCSLGHVGSHEDQRGPP